MDRNVAAVIQGFVALTDAQGAEFVESVNEYINGAAPTKERIVREARRDFGAITKVDLGPVSQACPCCGR